MDHNVLSELLNPSIYPDPTHEVQLKQTHVSYLFLTDNYVYKVKKAVNFGFLDFTHLEQRKFFCHEEVRLNSRLCPGMYLGVVEIRRSPGGICLNGEGELIDYAVKMQRLPAERMLNILLQNDTVTLKDIRDIVRVIGKFHLTAETNASIAVHGRPDAIRRNWRENLRQLAPFVPEIISRDDLSFIRKWGYSFLTRHVPLLQRRVTSGFIRDCDGDIHSENICLADKIRIFDCIEFNDRFRYSDTAADIAFLLMDLDFHYRPDLANVAVTAYTAITGDKECRELIPYYKVYRAVIRGKVEALRAIDQQAPPDERQDARAKAQAYFRLARGLILREQIHPTLFITCGLMGSGKTVLAKALGFELGVPVVRSDVVRKELAGLSPTRSIAAEYGMDIYTLEMTRRTYAALANHARRCLVNGSSVIVDASFSAAGERSRFAALARELKVPFYILALQGGDRLHKKRLAARTVAGMDASDGRLELFATQKRQFSPPGSAKPVITLAAARTPDTLLKQIYRSLLGT